LLPSIRKDLGARLGFGAEPSFITGPDGSPENPTQSTGTLSYSWGEAAGGGTAEYKYLLEGWHKASNSEAITYLTGFTADKRPAWPDSWSTETEHSFSGLSNGHYTMHLLRRDGTGTTYQASRTVLVNATGGGGGKRPRR
jgi:hypothetical protein